MIKEVIFFSYGDSAKIETWSNVPYLFTKNLESLEIKTHRVNLLPHKFVILSYNILITILCKIFKIEKTTLTQTKLYQYYAQRIIKKNVQTYHNADYCIFSCFDFYNHYNTIPTILFCDWDYITYLQRMKKIPTRKDLRFIAQQKNAIKNAKYVISLFPECANNISKEFKTNNIFYLGGNVINCVYNGEINPTIIIPQKKRNNLILFIGSRKYLESALLIIKAFKILKVKIPSLNLHIVGLTNQDLNISLPENIFAYGYLNKSNPEQNNLYYNLLKQASVIVNPTPIWAGFSSIIEAMYFYTPVIVSPYLDFVKTFGSNIKFGIYNTTYSEYEIEKNIRKIITSNLYEEQCFCAHEVVKDFTWKRYMEKFIQTITN